MKNLIIAAAFGVSLFGAGKMIAVKATTTSPADMTCGHDSSMHKVLAPEVVEVDGTLTSGMEIIASAVCEGIEKHEPVAAGTVFDCEVGRIWVHSQVKMRKGESGTIKHVYIFKGKEISSVELDVKGPTFRTNSYKTITPKMIGDWKVEIRDGSGAVLKSHSFTITEASYGC